MKLRIPEDVALVGCDGIQDTEYLECPLTTLVQPVAEMCAKAWEFLSQRLKRPTMARQQAVLKPKLIIRESSLRTNGIVVPAKSPAERMTESSVSTSG